MGVHDLWDILGPTARPVRLEALRNKRLAVDASIWIYQFLKAVRDKDGNPMRNSHIVGFFRRICKLLYFGIKPVFVFDGGVPVLKRQTIRKRKERREGQRENMEKTAHRLLAKQLQRAADSKVNGVVKRDVSMESIQKSTEYYDGTKLKASPLKRKRDESESITFRGQDDYDLPQIEKFDVKKGDERMDTEQDYEKVQQEIRDDLDNVDLDNIDPRSEEFDKLPLATQYILLSHLRLRSRLRMGYTKDQLQEMFPDSMEFSKFQIQMVQKRNYFTQRLMNASGMNKEADMISAQRVAGEKDREYKLERTEGGYVMSITKKNENEGKDAMHAIELGEENESDGDENDGIDIQWESVTTEKNLPMRLSKSGISVAANESLASTTSSFLDPSIHTKEALFVDGDEDGEVEEVDDPVMEKIKSLYSYAQKNNKKKSVSVQEDLDDSEEEFEEEQLAAFEEVDLKQAIENSKKDYMNMLERQSNPGSAAAVLNDEQPIILTQQGLQKAMKLPQFSSGKSLLFRKTAPKAVPKVAPKVVEPVEESSDEEEAEDDDFEDVTPAEKPKPLPLPDWFKDIKQKENDRQRFQADIGMSNPVALDQETADERAGLRRYADVEELLSESGDESVIELDEEEVEVVEKPRETEKVEIEEVEVVEKPRETEKVEIEELDDSSDSDFDVELEDVGEPEVEEAAEESLKKAMEDPVEVNPAEKKDTKEAPPKNSELFVPSTPPQGPVITKAVEDYEFSEGEEEQLQETMKEEEDAYGKFVGQVSSQNPTNSGSIWSMDEEVKLQEQLRKQKRDSDEVTTAMIMDVQDLLARFGIPFITAPMEAEAQCAELYRLKLVDGIVTDDSDCFLFGGSLIYKNMFNEKMFVECYQLEEVENNMGLTRRQLIEIAILLGSDYTEGLKGVGKVTAVEILAEFKDLTKFREWWTDYQNGIIDQSKEDKVRKKLRKQLGKSVFLTDEFPEQEIYDAYFKPDVDHDKTEFKWGYPNLDKLRTFLMYNVGWPQSKVDQILVPVIRELNKPQKTIEQFFPVEVVRNRRELALGKRLKAATDRLKTSHDQQEAKRRRTSSS